jgi:hypothetical protein
MASLGVIDYESEMRAEEVWIALLKMQKEYLIDLIDAVVVIRDQKGKVRLRQLYNLTAAGAASGGFWGALIGRLCSWFIVGPRRITDFLAAQFSVSPRRQVVLPHLLVQRKAANPERFGRAIQHEIILSQGASNGVALLEFAHLAQQPGSTKLAAYPVRGYAPGVRARGAKSLAVLRGGFVARHG